MPTSQPAHITPGQAATIAAMSLPGGTLSGTVQSVNPVTDNQGTTVGVRILCANPGNQLKEGMPVIATIITAIHPHALTVPVSALVSDPSAPNKKMVYIFKDGKVTRAEVTPGIQNNTRIEITSTLKPGESIVESGAYGIPDGTEVEAQSEPVHSNSKVAGKSN
jgi:HlyD family secretion protein